MKNVTFTEFMTDKYHHREDKDNMYGVGITDHEFVFFCIRYLLDDDWYVTDPISMNQINELALYDILEKHSEKYRKEKRKFSKSKKFPGGIFGKLFCKEG